MNYKRIYEELIAAARQEWHIDREIHHIIPRCMNGSNNSDNLVGMSFRQHYIAHLLLYKIYRKEYPTLIFAIESFYSITRHKFIDIHRMPKWIRKNIFITRHLMNKNKFITYKGTTKGRLTPS